MVKNLVVGCSLGLDSIEAVLCDEDFKILKNETRPAPVKLGKEPIATKIEKTIQNLPDRCRQVFIVSRMNGLKNREIAEKLDISIKNVERHLSRAMHSFRENFKEEIPVALIVLVLKSLEFQ